MEKSTTSGLLRGGSCRRTRPCRLDGAPNFGASVYHKKYLNDQQAWICVKEVDTQKSWKRDIASKNIKSKA